MKRSKKVISLLLALVMTLTLCVPAFAKEKKTLNYVSLGASNSNGYALHGYLTEEMYANPVLSGALDGTPGDISGFRRTPEGSYPGLVAEYFENLGYQVNHAQLAQSSMRVEELRFLLDESYAGDNYTSWRFYDPDDSWTWWYGKLDEMRQDYKQELTNADFITYDMGINNFGVYLTSNILDPDFTNDVHNVFPKAYADLYYRIREKVKPAIVKLGIDEATQATLNNLTDTVTYAVVGYCMNFDKTMGIIRGWNKDATIVVLSIQNITKGLDASLKGVTIPLGDILGIASKLANTYMTVMSPYADEYYYADVSQNGRVTCFMDQALAYNGDPATLDQDMRDCMDVYDTSLPLYLRFRVAAYLAAADGDPIAQQAITDKDCLQKNLLYLENYCQEKYPDLYEQAKENAYDAMATLIKVGLEGNPASVDGMLAGADIDVIEDELCAGIDQMVSAVAEANWKGSTYSDEDIQNEIDKLLCSADVKTVAQIGLRASIGNTFFSHPNRQGHQELYEAIITALENKTSPHRAFVSSLEDMKREVIQDTLKFGTSFVSALAERLVSALHLNKSAVIFSVVPRNEKAADRLFSLLQIDSQEDIAALEQCIHGAENQSIRLVSTHVRTLMGQLLKPLCKVAAQR